MSETKQNKLHYAWVITFVGFISYWFAMCIVSNCAGMFVTTVSADLGVSRSAFSLTSTCISVASMAMSLFIGNIFRKLSIRKTMLIGAVVLPIAYGSFSLAPNVYVLYAVGVVVGLCMCPVAQVGVSTLISNWFNEKRGLAIAIAATGSGIGGIVMNPLIAALITNVGWRRTYFVLGCMMAATLIPCALFLIKDTPADKGLEPYGGAPAGGQADLQGAGMTLAQARRTPMFWMWCLIAAFSSGSCICAMQHTAAYVTDLGYTYAFAATVASIMTASLAAGKLLLGTLFDKLGTRLAATLSLSVFGVAFFLYGFAENVLFLYLAAGIIGFGLAFSSVAYSVVTQDLFGKKDFAAVYGNMIVFSGLGGAVSSPLIAAVFDTLGTYKPAWVFLVGVQVLSLVLLQAVFANKKKLG